MNGGFATAAIRCGVCRPQQATGGCQRQDNPFSIPAQNPHWVRARTSSRNTNAIAATKRAADSKMASLLFIPEYAMPLFRFSTRYNDLLSVAPP